jgi:hypothetical protein
MAAQGGEGAGSAGSGATVTIATFYNEPGRIHFTVAAKGAFNLTESFTSDDGTTWVKFKRTASAVLATPTTDRGNVVDLADFILHKGHRLEFTDTSAATNPFEFSYGSQYIEGTS